MINLDPIPTMYVFKAYSWFSALLALFSIFSKLNKTTHLFTDIYSSVIGFNVVHESLNTIL